MKFYRTRVVASWIAFSLVVGAGWVLAVEQGLLPSMSHKKQVVQRACEGYVALTFDDGPSDQSSDLLDVLKANDIRATFFVNGENVSEFPGVVQRMLKEGHSVQNHGWDHKSMTGVSTEEAPLSISEIKDQISSTADAIAAHGGGTVMFRPPYGDHNSDVAQAEQATSHFDVGWDVDTFDYKAARPADVSARFSAANAGDIVLLHEKPVTTDAIDLISEIMSNKSLCPGRIIHSHEKKSVWEGYDYAASVVKW